MKKQINVEEKIINLFYDENNIEKVPVIILNTFDEDGEKIWDLSRKLNSKEYILVTISNINWNEEMSPWYMDKLYKNDSEYTGKADEYIKILVDKIVPQIRNVINSELKKEISYFTIAGYSLAGLFAVYSMYKTNIFRRIISCSGSYWYPNFIEFVNSEEVKNKAEKIYFSLGNKESKVKNEMISKVEENTKYLAEFYKENGIETIYVENEGNHFQDVISRIVKGICWILD